MNNKWGVRVKTTEDSIFGWIIRRIDASSYEIFLDNGKTVTLSPEEFKELRDE